MSRHFAKLAPLSAVAAVVLALAPQAASALQFEYKGAQVPSFLNVNYNRVAPAKTNASQGAGAFKFNEAAAGGLGDFVAWCFDLDTTISQGTYTYEQKDDLLESNTPYVTGAKGRIQKLFDSSYDIGTGGVLSSPTNSAAFQLAVWEVLYDDDFNLGVMTGQNFSGGGSTAAITTAAAGYLSAASTYDSYKRWKITTYDGISTPNTQDIGVATAIPLPAAAWLLLGVSGALIGAKRRSARKAA